MARLARRRVHGATTRYVLCRHQVVEEFDGTGAWQALYVYEDGIDQPRAMDRADIADVDGDLNTVEVFRFHYHQNALGSVYEMTDPTGAVVEWVTYDIYGAATVRNQVGTVVAQSAIGNPNLYIGREYDPESGKYFYRARTYDPSAGRFLQRDPLGYVDGMGLYEYVRSSPTVFTDPSGNRIQIEGGTGEDAAKNVEEAKLALVAVALIAGLMPIFTPSDGDPTIIDVTFVPLDICLTRTSEEARRILRKLEAVGVWTIKLEPVMIRDENTPGPDGEIPNPNTFGNAAALGSVVFIAAGQAAIGLWVAAWHLMHELIHIYNGQLAYEAEKAYLEQMKTLAADPPTSSEIEDAANEKRREARAVEDGDGDDLGAVDRESLVRGQVGVGRRRNHDDPGPFDPPAPILGFPPFPFMDPMLPFPII